MATSSSHSSAAGEAKAVIKSLMSLVPRSSSLPECEHPERARSDGFVPRGEEDGAVVTGRTFHVLFKVAPENLFAYLISPCSV